MRGLLSRLCLVVLLGVLMALQPAQAQQTQRSLMMVWDSSATGIARDHREMVKEIKAIRAQGHFAGIPDFQQTVRVYDFGVPGHAAALQKLGLTREGNCPYLSVVNLDDEGVPSKVLWGIRYFTKEDGLKGVDTYLGIKDTGQHVALDTTTQLNPVIDAGPLPPTGNLPPLVSDKRKILNGPAWLRARSETIRFGAQKVKLIYSVDTRAKYNTLEEWATPFKDQLNYETVISHSLGTHYQALPPDQGMLLGWIDNDGKSAWVAIWREKDGWRHTSNNDKTSVFSYEEDPFVLTWPIDHGDYIQLKLSIPTPRKPATKNDLVYDLSVHAGHGGL